MLQVIDRPAYQLAGHSTKPGGMIGDTALAPRRFKDASPQEKMDTGENRMRPQSSSARTRRSAYAAFD
ncbi:hypothetical protein ACP_3439 [Acidobacterium capsulatum ATCC 51196]|uniref:Uncharacterized protein n=1 Tax=Acidobacterium capsulatum (strain ATCC 51196 / DSM 11244 / BCRC 80197 / JCM 7670 / NBRC 15755 / NCIMB 13165 / 161) TaxID=240015 RepID=C1F6X0_ACIC5|nr:hypothetical protein ACP_3439 [Acidobacterium capsulatum ATCC 51196]